MSPESTSIATQSKLRFPIVCFSSLKNFIVKIILFVNSILSRIEVQSELVHSVSCCTAGTVPGTEQAHGKYLVNVHDMPSAKEATKTNMKWFPTWRRWSLWCARNPAAQGVHGLEEWTGHDLQRPVQLFECGQCQQFSWPKRACACRKRWESGRER